MKPNHPSWQLLLPPFEAEQWDECARIVRAWVDDDPYDLTSRALLASLYAKAGGLELARLQYEKLLPMAVGQSGVLWALCTQKRLDELQPGAEDPKARFHAMHEWFRYLVPDPGTKRRKPKRGFSASALTGLPDDIFSGSAERATMHDLGLARRSIAVGDGILWMVYYGRVRCRGVDVRGDAVEHVAETGEAIFLHAGEYADAFELMPEIPTECIAFEPALASLLGLAMSTTPHGRPGLNQMVHGKHHDDAEPWTVDVGGDADEEAEATVLPRPDPMLEPTRAAAGAHERRRETRVAVALENRVAFLGEIGKRVSPLHGRLVDLSTSGLGVTFPAAQLRQTTGVFADAVLPVKLSLRGVGEPIELAARVAWIRKGDSEGDGEARMGLEFIAVSPENRSRLIHIIDEAARSGISF